jgi:hypothetical protein
VSTLQLLNRAGMEIASHSVAHSRGFVAMSAGSGRERYPGYRPYVTGYDTVRNASIMGELRISRFLLDTLGETRIQSFRPGHLSLPESLPQMLVANGFPYSSSITANVALTHLPYRLMDNRAFESEVEAWEFPVTIEDELDNFGGRFDAAVDVAEQIAAYNGLVNVMIHTDGLDYKLAFEQRWLEKFKDRAWFDTVAGFGAWWALRDSVNLRVDAGSPTLRRVHVSAGGSLDGLTIEVPPGWRYQSGLDGTRQRGERVTLGRFSDEAELVFATGSP